MSKLELILLGQFDCLLPSGKRISLPMRKAEVLLAYLALTPGIRHPRERLINLLWSDRSEEQARNSLRQCLSAIRKLLEEAANMVLQVDRNTVCLNAELAEVDIHEFERLAAEGDYESLITAADLYQGEFLEGISIRDPASQEWLDNERARFKRQFIEILTNLAETQLVSHDFKHAIRSAERLVKQDPLGESGWRLLMRSYHESGDRNHALQTFKRCQQALREELEIDPETATIELRDQIAGGETMPASTPIPATRNSTAGPSSPTDHSIAVLPFENMSDDPGQEHFADGITTDIIATLSRFRRMRTVARYSILQYKDQKTPIADIAEQQKTRYILEGSVRKSGDRIRVSAELIDSKTGRLCWSERFDRDLDDLFAVQDEITQNIAIAMKVQMDDGEMALHRSKGATSIKAWELTLAAVDLADTYIRQNILDARAMVNEAIQLDPNYAYAWITLGWTYWQEAYSGWSNSIEALIEEAERANQHAMGLDPDYGEAWILAGMNHQMRHEPEAAIAACLKAVELEPGSADVHALTAWAFLANGDCAAAREHEQRMVDLCPIRPNWYYGMSGGIEKKCGNLDQAIELYKQGLEIEPDAPLCRFLLIDALIEKGEDSRAQQLANEIQALDKSMTGKGIVHCNSFDAGERQRFHDNLAKFDLV